MRAHGYRRWTLIVVRRRGLRRPHLALGLRWLLWEVAQRRHEVARVFELHLLDRLGRLRIEARIVLGDRRGRGLLDRATRLDLGELYARDLRGLARLIRRHLFDDGRRRRRLRRGNDEHLVARGSRRRLVRLVSTAVGHDSVGLADRLFGLRNEQLLEVELRDRRERRQVLERRLVDHLHQRPLAVEQTQDPVQLVGDLVEALEQLLMIDLEDRGQRRQLFTQSAPLVYAPHALHEDALRGGADDVVVLHRREDDLELGLVPDERAVDRLFAT